MSNEICYSSSNQYMTNSEVLLPILFQSLAKQQLQEEKIEQLILENSQLKNALAMQHDACCQRDEWLINAQSKNVVLHNYLKTVTEENNKTKAQLDLVIRFLCELKSWLNITTFAICFPSHTNQCAQIDQLLFDKVLIPRFLAIISPTNLPITEAEALLKELQQADQVLKDEIRSKYSDKVWLVLSKLLHPPYLTKGFLNKLQFFEVFYKNFWSKKKSLSSINARVNQRLKKAINTTKLMLLTLQDENNRDLITDILNSITQHFKGNHSAN